MFLKENEKGEVRGGVFFFKGKGKRRGEVR